MDKVIDGVDVSECKYYIDADNDDLCSKLSTGYDLHYVKCANYPNCSYKQLKRKEIALDDAYDQIHHLEQECERLKETEKEISDFISDISTCGFRYDDRCPDNLDELQQCIEDLCNKFDNYKQALQDIRELIKKLDLSLGCAYGDYDCDNCSDINEETVCKIKLQNIILAKINEVIGEE